MDDWDKFEYEEKREESKAMYADSAEAPKELQERRKLPSM